MLNEPETNSPPHTFSFKKTLLFSFLPMLVLLSILEGGARLVELLLPPLNLDYGWGFNEDSRVFVPAGINRNLMVTRPEKLGNFVGQSFEMPKPADVFRILVMGGSNVFDQYSRLLEMARSLSDTPGETRRFDIVNAGGEGYGSHRLRVMVPEMIGYDPDLVILYSGHNEFVEKDQQALVDLERLWVQRIAYSSALLRLVRDLGATVSLTRRFSLAARNEKSIQLNPGFGSSQAISDAEIEGRMRLYRENLTHIITSFQERGIPVILCTVATNLWYPVPRQPYWDIVDQVRAMYAEGRIDEGMQFAREILVKCVRPQASDLENSIIRSVAETLGVLLLEGEKIIAAAEPNGIPGETLMTDACHLNEAGRDILIQAYEQEIRRMLDLPEAAPRLQ